MSVARFIRFAIACLGAGALPCSVALAAPGELDAGFGDSGKVEIAPPDVDEATDYLVARYSADGERDRSFSSNGWTTHDLGYLEVATGVGRDRDRHIVVAGQVKHIPGADTMAVLRYQR